MRVISFGRWHLLGDLDYSGYHKNLIQQLFIFPHQILPWLFSVPQRLFQDQNYQQALMFHEIRPGRKSSKCIKYKLLYGRPTLQWGEYCIGQSMSKPTCYSGYQRSFILLCGGSWSATKHKQSSFREVITLKHLFSRLNDYWSIHASLW